MWKNDTNQLQAQRDGWINDFPCKWNDQKSNSTSFWSQPQCPNSTPQPFYGPFSGTTGWASARRELLDFMVQGEINRDRHTDHPAGHHSIRTNQCPPPSSPHFLQAGCPSCRPTNSVKALKAMPQLSDQYTTITIPIWLMLLVHMNGLDSIWFSSAGHLWSKWQVTDNKN